MQSVLDPQLHSAPQPIPGFERGLRQPAQHCPPCSDTHYQRPHLEPEICSVSSGLQESSGLQPRHRGRGGDAHPVVTHSLLRNLYGAAGR
ncbi:unnamed protein product [Arctogadus glacialis]